MMPSTVITSYSIHYTKLYEYQNDVKALDSEETEHYALMEWYYRVRLVTDYVSGMTDDYSYNFV